MLGLVRLCLVRLGLFRLGLGVKYLVLGITKTLLESEKVLK